MSFNFKTIDPDGDEVYYYIDWGDNSNSGWIGPYSSGVKITKLHTWSTEGAYLIKVKAKDVSNAEGDWGSLDVTIPKGMGYLLSLFFNMIERLIERFPHAFLLLQNMLG